MRLKNKNYNSISMGQGELKSIQESLFQPKQPAFVMKSTAFPSQRLSADYGEKRSTSSNYIDKFLDETEGSGMETRNSLVLG